MQAPVNQPDHPLHLVASYDQVAGGPILTQNPNGATKYVPGESETGKGFLKPNEIYI